VTIGIAWNIQPAEEWLGITRRFASMTPEEQRRIQVQMQEWGKLTPAQRRSGT
jgi:hypothetical protein